MKSVCFLFQVHQPFRYRRYRFFDIGNDHYYYDDYANETTLRKVAESSYLPTNNLLLKLLRNYQGEFKVAFSISGVALEQFETYAPEVIESFQELAKTGCVEFTSGLFTHSLTSLISGRLFEEQALRHRDKIQELFGQKPKVFVNSELIYSDEIGARIAKMRFEATATEGAKHVLGWKSPNFVYVNAINPRLKILMRNFKLSDDIAFRFSNKAWQEFPLTAEKFAGWLQKSEKNDEVINLSMNYETFGEIQKKESGIFKFTEALPEAVLKTGEFDFATPSEIITDRQPISAVHVPNPVSWAGEERDLSAWLGNELQDEAFQKLNLLSGRMQKCDDPAMGKDWDYLQDCDHFYYMSARFFDNAEVSKFHNPYDSPYDAFINYMNVLSDFKLRLDKLAPEEKIQQEIASLIKIIEQKEARIKKYEVEARQLRKTRRNKATRKK